MPAVTREEQLESVLSVAAQVAQRGLVRLVDIQQRTGIGRERLSALAGILREQGRWPYKVDQSKEARAAARAADLEAAQLKPIRERRPPVSDLAAYRAWAEKERERLANEQAQAPKTDKRNRKFKFKCGKETPP